MAGYYHAPSRRQHAEGSGEPGRAHPARRHHMVAERLFTETDSKISRPFRLVPQGTKLPTALKSWHGGCAWKTRKGPFHALFRTVIRHPRGWAGQDISCAQGRVGRAAAERFCARISCARPLAACSGMCAISPKSRPHGSQRRIICDSSTGGACRNSVAAIVALVRAGFIAWL